MLITAFFSVAFSISAQTSKTEFYELIKKLIYDSTGYENVGDWAVGKPNKFPVSWKADKIEMSPDTSINFYRSGTADLKVKEKSFLVAGKPITWYVMLKGPRMGYASFSILSQASKDIQPKFTLDSLFGKKPFTAKLIKSCDDKTVAGYYYYELKIPEKDTAFLKISWVSANGSTALRVDGYDNWSKYAVKLDCPR